MTTIHWVQGGGCGGDTMSLLSTETPNVVQLFQSLDLDLLWHPSLSNLPPAEQTILHERLVSGRQHLDILVVEGSILHGPVGSGMFDTRLGRPKRELVAELATQAEYVVAAGTCASYGGFGARGETQAGGLQWDRGQKGGLLGPDFVSRGGSPVINLAGCPCHHDVMAGTLLALTSGFPLPLDEYNRPQHWYGVMVHQGCTRNEYHEYRIEEQDFGQKGCLFFHMGCHGPLVGGPCNKLLWNQRSSKTRVGVPCFGCTDPEFPPPYPFFQTRNIEGIPLQLPKGIDRAHYMAYKGMAAAAAPRRLKDRITDI
ncbi:MAG: NADH-quinone oxidoreductase subunit B family protein [Thermoleophilia bacterium]